MDDLQRAHQNVGAAMTAMAQLLYLTTRAECDTLLEALVGVLSSAQPRHDESLALRSMEPRALLDHLQRQRVHAPPPPPALAEPERPKREIRKRTRSPSPPPQHVGNGGGGGDDHMEWDPIQYPRVIQVVGWDTETCTLRILAKRHGRGHHAPRIFFVTPHTVANHTELYFATKRYFCAAGAAAPPPELPYFDAVAPESPALRDLAEAAARDLPKM